MVLESLREGQPSSVLDIQGNPNNQFSQPGLCSLLPDQAPMPSRSISFRMKIGVVALLALAIVSPLAVHGQEVVSVDWYGVTW